MFVDMDVDVVDVNVFENALGHGVSSCFPSIEMSQAINFRFQTVTVPCSDTIEHQGEIK